jgi:hypothetical protein
MLKVLAECQYAECHYAECHYAECHYAECHYAECRYAGCHGAYILPHLTWQWENLLKIPKFTYFSQFIFLQGHLHSGKCRVVQKN